MATTLEEGEYKVIGTMQFEASWEYPSGPKKGQKIDGKPQVFFSNLAVAKEYRNRVIRTIDRNNFCRAYAQR